MPAPPRLPTGVPLLRRDRHHLQVGLSPAVVLPDAPDVRDLLARLREGRAPSAESPDSPAARAALVRLDAAGLLEDAAADAVRRERRRACTVVVDAREEAAAAIGAVLRRAGLGVAAPGAPLPAHPDGEEGSGTSPVCVLVVRDGVLARGDLDEATRTGVPHLVVAHDHAGTVVGPFVVPGASACVRCIDAHASTRDPRWPVLVEQAARQQPPPRDPVRHALAVSWAAGDLRLWAEGRTPSTWSATVRIGEDLVVTRESWSRHPACGCAWGTFISAGAD
ncbi:hypothetical protein [Nocardioides sp. zg-DK7169]|uniref:hypothetical protein n=1 Tax=Nocardioides sp. zg-DK7169 TaxID=2736600 RepID=UPI001554B332|nr:hypothetical protein [Nocardioides sp. zg-DK7169]NPC96012.1 hypothetical protein [Nocardioides sp. zg-DK7169]